MKKQMRSKKIHSPNLFLTTFSFLFFCFFAATFVLGKTVYAYSKFYPNGESTCLTSSGGRQSFQSVLYACSMAVCRTSLTPAQCRAQRGQNGCSTWLGPVGNSTTRTIRLSAPSINSTVNVQFFGMCTDASDMASSILITNDNGSIVPITFNRPGTWGSPWGPTTTLNVAKFVTGSGVTVTTNNNIKTYYRRVMIDRSHSDSASAGIDWADIYITIGGTPPEPDPTPASCANWGSVVPGTTSTLIKIKNNALFARSGGAVGDWTEGNVYAKPTDRVAWHSCYWPGVQTEAFKVISKVTGDYNWKGYEDVPTDRCEANPHHVQEKKLSEAIEWYHNFSLSNSVGLGGRSPSGASMGNQAPGGNYTIGDYTGKEADNEANTLTSDAGATITETSTTSTPIKVVLGDETLNPVSIYGGTCHKNNSSGVDSMKIGDTTYPICPATAIFTDPITGAYFNPSYPDILGQVPEVPATVTTPKVDAYYCWKPISGKAKNCQDCFGDKNCMDNLGCNTCNGNTECTCNDDYQCLQCTNTYDKTSIKVANVKKGPAAKSASVIVPYNYKLDTGVTLDTSYPVYAGETVKINDFWVDILTRYNGATYDDYATIVPSAKYALVAYVTKDSSGGFGGGDEVAGKFSDLCNDVYNKIGGENKPKQCIKLVEKDGETLNPSGNLGGNPHESHLGEIGGEIQNAFDASAGDYLCMVSAIWPTESAGDTDTGSGGNNKSRYSAPSCVPINKRPTFQVWGGDMYSRVEVNNPFADKRNVYAGYWGGNWKLGGNFKISGSNATHFGSWVEEGLMLGGNKVGTNTYGKTDTIASGAALGNNNDEKNKAKAYTGNSGKFCENLAPLTFSNDCSGSGPAESAKIASLTGSRRDLISYWVSNAGSNVSGSRNLGSLWDSAAKQESATDTEIRHLKANGSLTITGGTMSKRRLLLIDKGTADTTVTISGNIKYESPLNSLADIPKLIIYAKNINIECNVTEIDAILIADGTVNTCSDGGDDSDSARANRLEIFGTVIANNVKLGRTYGAAAWKASGPNGQREAAEVFNYDSTMLMWSEYMSSSAQTDTLQTVYQHELAPRY